MAVTSPNPAETGMGKEDVRRRPAVRKAAAGRRPGRCGRACKAAARRARVYRAEAVAIGFAIILDGRRAEGGTVNKATATNEDVPLASGNTAQAVEQVPGPPP
ncbi:hypothetical protein [Streptomyces sp. NPDC058548]|uniref:hypothetical protein n=1 Tax=Streptomyces sp. NPDC058548 TaxID=3346545 RepID=UPI003648A5CA